MIVRSGIFGYQVSGTPTRTVLFRPHHTRSPHQPLLSRTSQQTLNVRRPLSRTNYAPIPICTSLPPLDLGRLNPTRPSVLQPSPLQKPSLSNDLTSTSYVRSTARSIACTYLTAPPSNVTPLIARGQTPAPRKNLPSFVASHQPSPFCTFVPLPRSVGRYTPPVLSKTVELPLLHADPSTSHPCLPFATRSYLVFG